MDRDEVLKTLGELTGALDRGPTPESAAQPKCAACGTATVTRWVVYCPPCREVAALRDRRDAIARAWRTVPEALRWAAFDSPTLPHWAPDDEAIAAARAHLDAPLVTLVGLMRAGKTTIAACMLREHLRRGAAKAAMARDVYRARTARFVTTMDLLRERDTTRLGQDHMPLRDVCERASVLVIDELGRARDPHGVLYGLLHDRHARGRQTIVTTWLSREQCAETYGGIAGRLFDDGIVINVRKAAA